MQELHLHLGPELMSYVVIMIIIYNYVLLAQRTAMAGDMTQMQHTQLKFVQGGVFVKDKTVLKWTNWQTKGRE